MLLEHDRNYDLGMDALVTVCSWNTNGIMIWARPAPGHMRSRSLERSARPLKVGTSATVPWLRATFCTASAAGPKVLKARANLTLQGKNALEKPVRGIPLHVRPNGWAEG